MLKPKEIFQTIALCIHFLEENQFTDDEQSLEFFDVSAKNTPTISVMSVRARVELTLIYIQ